jgi:hypothetical protein
MLMRHTQQQAHSLLSTYSACVELYAHCVHAHDPIHQLLLLLLLLLLQASGVGRCCAAAAGEAHLHTTA